ncbi:UPF0182 family protein [Corynebacterium durum]|uniref:UPF0182 family protein n=1 Tax=Corynebacterium durum TaxID=61592 RepID=UPI0028E83485|nr:UPF0182 family protein [Corynebacterium durum]
MATGLTPPSPSIKRPPRILTIIIAVVAVIGLVGPLLVSYYTDWLWFGEVQFRSVFTTVLVTRLVLFFVFALVTAAIVWLAGYVAYRNRPDLMTEFGVSSPIVEYRRIMERSVRKILVTLPIIAGAVAGAIGQNSWQTVQMFLNGQSFGQRDPQFNMDYGFYAFTLPMLRLVIGSFSVLLLVAFVIMLIGNYLLGGIRVGNQALGVKSSITTAARVQLMVVLGLWMLLRVVSYWLDRFDLLSSQQAMFTGAGYTSIHAILPAKILLMVIAVVVAAAFFSAIVLRDMRIPALATVLMLFSSLIIGVAWPYVVEQFSVQPNRAEKETPYIGRNIEATRYAYGLTDDKVTYMNNWGAQGATDEEVASDANTLSNIRLLDPEILSPTFTQQQQLKNFYGFPKSLTMDRYNVDGEFRDYVVAAREMDPQALSDNQRDWVNRHTVYTHGNGFIAAPANKVDEVARDVGSTRGGFPVYTVSDLQSIERNASSPDAESPDKLGINVTQPRMYFGPVIANVPDNLDYAIVGKAGGENSFEYDTDTSNFTYDGNGGVNISNPVNRAAFALQYQEMKLLLSDRIGDGSKIIFNRDPRARVEKVAPWLTTDTTTYPTVINGRIKWIVDGYTTLGSLPYSQRTSLTEATEDAINPTGTTQQMLTEQVGYIRNSVKAVVDAYDGSVELYEFDEQDPVLKAWKGVFPGTVKPKSEISDELRDHLRYPEDLFKVQRSLITKYHVNDPRQFFTNDAFWSVPGDPTVENENRQNLNQPPYYIVAADPETKKPSFQLITPFRGLKREFLAAHMSVSSDPDNYGKITVRVLPTDTQTQGPKQAQDTMMSSDQVARDRSLWKGTNDLKNGNLLTLPVGGGQILYVEPIYSQRRDQTSAFPKLLRVLVSYNGKVGYAPTIAEALSQVGIDPREASDVEDAVAAGADTTANKGDDAQGNNNDTQQPASAPAASSEGEALDRVNKALDGLQEAKGKSFEEYGKAIDELDRAVDEYRKIKDGGGQ